MNPNLMKRSVFLVVVVLMLLAPVGSTMATVMAANGTDPLALPSTPTATLNVTVDGAPLTVTNYRVVYVANPVAVRTRH